MIGPHIRPLGKITLGVNRDLPVDLSDPRIERRGLKRGAIPKININGIGVGLGIWLLDRRGRIGAGRNPGGFADRDLALHFDPASLPFGARECAMLDHPTVDDQIDVRHRRDFRTHAQARPDRVGSGAVPADLAAGLLAVDFEQHQRSRGEETATARDRRDPLGHRRRHRRVCIGATIREHATRRIIGRAQRGETISGVQHGVPALQFDPAIDAELQELDGADGPQCRVRPDFLTVAAMRHERMAAPRDRLASDLAMDRPVVGDMPAPRPDEIVAEIQIEMPVGGAPILLS